MTRTEEERVKQRMRMGGMVLLSTLVLAGCATKSQLNEGLSVQRNELRALQQQLEQEKQAREAADQRLASDVSALRSQLEALGREVGGRVTALEDGLRFTLPVHFAFNGAEVQPEDQPALDRFATVVERLFPGAVITVEGHTDPAGSRAYNQRLSQQRAEAVREYIVAKGVTGEVRAIGYGESRPVKANAKGDEPGAEQNRRVVFVVESAPAGRS